MKRHPAVLVSGLKRLWLMLVHVCVSDVRFATIQSCSKGMKGARISTLE